MANHANRLLDGHAYERMGELESISFDFISLTSKVSKHVGSEGDIFVEAHRNWFAIIE